MGGQHAIAALRETHMLHSAEDKLRGDWMEGAALCVKVGRRGHVSQSFDWMCKVQGLTKEERTELKYEVEKTAVYCSHIIVAARCQKEWIPKPLLEVSKWS